MSLAARLDRACALAGMGTIQGCCFLLGAVVNLSQAPLVVYSVSTLNNNFHTLLLISLCVAAPLPVRPATGLFSFCRVARKHKRARSDASNHAHHLAQLSWERLRCKQRAARADSLLSAAERGWKQLREHTLSKASGLGIRTLGTHGGGGSNACARPPARPTPAQYTMVRPFVPHIVYW